MRRRTERAQRLSTFSGKTLSDQLDGHGHGLAAAKTQGRDAALPAIVA
jgi:uncharacterized caspase-like protein